MSAVDPSDILAASRIKGITFDRARQKFTSQMQARVVTPSAPHKVQFLPLRTSSYVDTYVAAATCLDAALVFLTDGRCRAKNLTGFPCIDAMEAMQSKGVRDFKTEVVDYNAGAHVFLAHVGFLVRIDRKIVRERTLKAHEQIRFSCDEPGAPLGCRDWAESIHQRNRNIMLSAPAGFGKSHLIRNVLRPVLEKAFGPQGLWVNASTGLAASALEGVTIHSAAGLQWGHMKAEAVKRGMSTSAKARWRHVKAIVIEEFSMLSADFLDLLDAVARLMKKVEQAFGGVLVILVGDLAQLAPVPDFQATGSLEGPKWKKHPAEYAFESKVWSQANFECCRLRHCWRYDINGRLGKFLSALRVAPTLTADLYEEMKLLLLRTAADVEEAVMLCCRKKRLVCCP